MKVNTEVHHLSDRVQWEFKAIEKYLMGKGIDVGCGTNRLSEDVLSIDNQPNKEYAHADVVHDCKDLDIKNPFEFKGVGYNFSDGELDFIFSSHCLEDFENIEGVFKNWWRKLKINGLMILLLPDMEPCKCKLCDNDSAIEYRKKEGRTARYWTIEDYKKNGKGNPAHRTNVGKKFMVKMLEKFPHEMIQMDTLPHNQTCSIDFVIKKMEA